MGRPLNIQYGPALSLKQTIEAGETFDVTTTHPRCDRRINSERKDRAWVSR